MYTQHIFATLALALSAFVGASASYTKLGCYSDVPDLKNDSTYSYQAYGACLNTCSQDNYKIAVLSKGNHCACSNAVPPDSAKVSDDKCKTPCPGYPTDYCGGDDAYMVLSQYVVSESGGGAAATPTAVTAAGGIVVVATNVNPSTIPTSILTAPGTMISKAGVSGATSSSAAVTAASSSASASPTTNAAVSLRGGPSVAGVLVAGLGLLL